MNHGLEAKAANQTYRFKTYEIVTQDDHEKGVIHWESTAYRGLHYLRAEIKFNGKTLYRSTLGIFIE